MTENPIKKNRYVNDITFATRLASFIKYVGKKHGTKDFIVDAVRPSITRVDEDLVEYQRQTMT